MALAINERGGMSPIFRITLATLLLPIWVGCMPVETIPKKWLNYRLEPARAEKDNLQGSSDLWTKPIPFGALNPDWVKFKNRLHPNDELWQWTNFDGEFGYCIKRSEKVIAVFTVHKRKPSIVKKR